MDERIDPGSRGWNLMIAEHLSRYQFAAQYAEGKRVLDAGTGCGYGAALLAESGAKEVIAIDIDQDALARARECFGNSGATYVHDNCERMDNVEGQFDLIVNFENIEHLDNPDAFLAQAAKRLAPGGVLLVSTPDADIRPQPDGKPVNPFHVREWSRPEFRQVLGEFFGGVEMQCQIRSMGLLQRKELVDQLQTCLLDLYDSPFVRLSRAVKRVLGLGKPAVWPIFSELKLANPEDYPIVPDSMANHLGKPICAMAICREPIVASAVQPESKAA